MPFHEGQEHSGFRLDQIAPLPDLNATLLRLCHLRTGAQYIHLAAADPNNLFAVGFRTPPRDSTGVAHILEHTVLCGSRRYRVRDPFFSMIKRSLHTFMNAITAADWTLYPFSSQNEKDFYNLMGVYLDAVFFPLLRKQAFLQEGHRLELAEPSSPESALVRMGVVYNEMKGAMADPHSLLGQRVAEVLYPTTTYGKNSGGDPAHIAELTWRDLRAFHAAAYHPSNSYFFSYGDLPLERHLDAVERLALRRFGPREVDTAVGDEVRFPAPRRVTVGYPVEPGEPTQGKAMVQLAWLNRRVTDSFGCLALDLLSSLLVGNPAAPLHKALLDSKLGSNLAPGTGYSAENRETYFAAGLQDAEADRSAAIEDLILSTLGRVCRDGFPPDRIAAAIHRLEFDHREVRGNHYPYALSLLNRLMGPWIHGGDPVSALSLGPDLERLRRELDKGPFFSDALRTELIENPHRVTVTLVPDPALAKQEAIEAEECLTALRRSLTARDRRRLLRQARELQEAQEASEDLSCLPTVALSDIPRQERLVPCEAGAGTPVPLSWYDQPTNGIAYFAAQLEAADLPDELVPYVPLFCALLPQVGASGYPYTEMAERIEAATGGVRADEAVLEHPIRAGSFRSLVTVKAKALAPNAAKMFGVLADLFAAPDFADLDRVHTVIGQLRTDLENSIPNAGHRFAARAAAASLSPAAFLRERWSGAAHLRFVRALAARKPQELAEASARLQSLARWLLTRAGARCGVTAEGRSFPAIRDALGPFLEGLRSAPRPAGACPPPPGTARTSRRLGLAASVPVCFTARVFPCASYTHPDSAGLLILAKLLRSGYLHREIREKGGAYGGIAAYDPEAGLFSVMSYRDPHLARTLRVYDEAAEWAAAGRFGAEDVEEAILGVFGDLDRPLSPAGRGDRELAQAAQGITREMRQQLREGVLAAQPEHLAALAERYLRQGRAASAVAAVASEEALRQANQELGDESLAVERL